MATKDISNLTDELIVTVKKINSTKLASNVIGTNKKIVISFAEKMKKVATELREKKDSLYDITYNDINEYVNTYSI